LNKDVQPKLCNMGLISQQLNLESLWVTGRRKKSCLKKRQYLASQLIERGGNKLLQARQKTRPHFLGAPCGLPKSCFVKQEWSKRWGYDEVMKILEPAAATWCWTQWNWSLKRMVFQQHSYLSATIQCSR
jgi:hypothetical protein